MPPFLLKKSRCVRFQDYRDIGASADALGAASAGKSRVPLLRGLHAADAFTDTSSCGKCVFVFETVPVGQTIYLSRTPLRPLPPHLYTRTLFADALLLAVFRFPQGR